MAGLQRTVKALVKKAVAEKSSMLHATKWGEILALLGIALGFGSWLYVLMSPQPNFFLGLLLTMGCSLSLAGAIAVWIPQRFSPSIGVIITLCMLLAGVLLYVHFGAHYLHAPTRAEIENEFDKLVQQQKWGELASRLPSLEGDSNLHDVWLYFSGVLCLHSSPRTTDPDRYLSLVPQDSPLFGYAQAERANGLVTNPNDVRLKDSIIDALLKARIKNPLYFALRLSPPPVLSHHEVMDLYEEFVALHKELFDFEHMRPGIKYRPGAPISVHVVDVGTISGCTLLLFLKRLETAYRDCVLSDVAVVSSQYDLLKRNVRYSELEYSLWLLHANPSVMERIEELRSKSIAGPCRGNPTKAARRHVTQGQ